MIIKLANVLNPEQQQQLKQFLAVGQFEDGRKTAGWHAQGVKQNLQWHAESEHMLDVNDWLSAQLAQHSEFTAATYPKYMAPFIISRSEQGGHYGDHIDDALMGHEQITRSDISCTIFLSEPDSYEGGDLVMDFAGEQLKFKLPAGSAIVYPSTTLHRVEPVTAGCREVAVTWIESYIRHASQREILFDLDQSRRDVLQQQGKSDSFDRLTKSHANLLRMWAET